jgi:hypothetical protein
MCQTLRGTQGPARASHHYVSHNADDFLGKQLGKGLILQDNTKMPP